MGTPATLLHGDAHFENIVLFQQGDSEQVLFIDWADARRGLASFDVAVFAVQSFPIPERRRQEEELVAAHVEHARAAGVSEWPDPWLDYRRGVLSWVVHMIQNVNLHHTDLPKFVIDRYVSAAVDLRIGELVL
jgi:aminoglycoside phosphotransferase (APT) family kinase protein